MLKNIRSDVGLGFPPDIFTTNSSESKQADVLGFKIQGLDFVIDIMMSNRSCVNRGSSLRKT